MELERLMDYEKTMEVENFRREIKTKLKSVREKLNYSYTELGRYLGKIWDSDPVYAAHWINDLDHGNLISRLNKGKKTDIEINKRKMADYLSAIGASKIFIEEISIDIAKLYPGFELPKSEIKAYEKNK
ncbi:MAG: hypothetical protein Q8R00_01400 [Candidatus Nanoarchaeia archaeon]|nr:hypothetical protein [Candidatus Nanoarchaeia archaeon]